MRTKPNAQGRTLFLLPFLIFHFLNIGTTPCQPAVQWDKTYGDLRENRLSKLMPLPDGSFVLAGKNFDTSEYETLGDFSHYGGYEYWVAKCDADGVLVWENEIDGTSDDELSDIVATLDGGFLVAGNSYSGVGNDKTGAAKGQSDFWVVKLDGQGNILWDRTYGGDRYDENPKIAALPDGGFLIAGTSTSTASFDKTWPNRRGEDIWMIRIDSGGNLLWDKSYGGRKPDKLTEFLSTTDGNFLLVAISHSSRDGYVSTTNAGRSDALVYKIAPDGSVLWEGMYGGTGDDEIYGAIQANDGGYLLVGTSNSITVNPPNNSFFFDYYEGWAVKIGHGGELEWQRAYGGKSKEIFNNVIQLPSGNYLLAGDSQSPMSGDKSEPARGELGVLGFWWEDFWAVEIDPQGNLVWDKCFGSNGRDQLSSLWYKGNGEFVLAGSSNSISGHEKSAPIIGSYDAWVVSAKVGGALCNYPFAPGRSCEKASLVCNLDNYCSSLTTSLEADCHIGFCNGWVKAENADYLAFYAGTPSITLNIKMANCTNPQGTVGMEAAIFRDCGSMEMVSNCWSAPGTADIQLTASGLETDSIYYLFLDGIDGCLCDYSVEVTSGVTGPAPPVVEVEQQVAGCFVNQLVLGGNQLLSGGDVFLNWVTDDGLVLSGRKTMAPTVGKPGTYHLHASHHIGGCRTNVKEEVEVTGPALKAEVEVNGCANEVVLNAGSSLVGNGVGFQWVAENGGSILSGGGTLTPTVTDMGSYRFTLNGSGCTDEQVIELPGDINIPEAVIGPPSDFFSCHNVMDPVLLDGTASTRSDDFDYYWSTQDGFVLDVFATDTLVIRPDAVGTYQLTIRNRETGCSDSASVEVLPNPFEDSGQILVVYADHGGNYLGCEVGQVQLKALTSYESPNITYSWYTPNGHFVSPTNIQAPIIDAPGSYSIEVFDVNSGCNDNIGFKIFEYTPPAGLEFSISTPWTCNTGGAVLDVGIVDTISFNEQIYYYEWSTTDGVILGNGNTRSPSIGAPGTYSVTITGVIGGCTKEGAYTVGNESLPPDIAMPQNPTLTCQTPALQIDLSGSSSGPGYCYWWETVDGHLAGPPNVLNPTVDQPGTYTLTIGNLQTGCTAQQDITVSGSNDQPVAQAIPTATIECGQISVQLNGSGSSTGSGFSYQWETPDGEIISGDNGLTPEVTASGQYVLTVTALNGGCTHTAAVQVDDNRFVLEENLPVSICEGEVYQLGGQVFDQAGDYDVPFVNVDGCDSIVHLALTILTLPEASIEASICDGESYEFGGQDINAGGAYTHTMVAANGCDSTTFLQLTVLDAPQTSLEVSVCPGEGYTVGTNTYSQSGSYVEVLQSVNGCDSTVTLELEVIEVLETEMNVAICQGDAYQFGSQAIGSAGVYYDTLASVAGCDSVLILNFGVLENTGSYITASICEGESYQIGGSVYSQAGSFVDTLTNVSGCDSIVELDLAVFSTSTTLIEEVICEGESITVGNMNYGATGTYTDTLENANGCDSTVTLELAVVPTIFVADTLVQPDNGSGNGAIGIVLGGGEPPFAYSWSNGGTGDSIANLVAGSYSVTVEDANGCLAEFTFEVLLQTGATEALMAAFNTKLYPNPAITNSTITLKVDTPGRVELEITVLDILGREFSLHAVQSLAGENTFDVPCPTFPGIYFVVIRYSGQILAMDKMVVAGE